MTITKDNVQEVLDRILTMYDLGSPIEDIYNYLTNERCTLEDDSALPIDKAIKMAGIKPMAWLKNDIIARKYGKVGRGENGGCEYFVTVDVVKDYYEKAIRRKTSQ